MFVEDVIEAETEFSVIEPRAAADGLVEKQVVKVKGRDRRLIVEGSLSKR